MSRFRVPASLALAVLLLAAVAQAQGRTASLVGYERAEMVQGVVQLSLDGSAVVLSGLTSVYGKTLEIYLAKGFDQESALKVGELSPDMPGDMTFEVSVADPASVDSVLVMVPGWDVPVAVGLFK